MRTPLRLLFWLFEAVAEEGMGELLRRTPLRRPSPKADLLAELLVVMVEVFLPACLDVSRLE